MYFGGDSRPPAMRETFRAGYFTAVIGCLAFPKQKQWKLNYLHSNTLKTFFCANNNFPM